MNIRLKSNNKRGFGLPDTRKAVLLEDLFCRLGFSLQKNSWIMAADDKPNNANLHLPQNYNGIVLDFVSTRNSIMTTSDAVSQQDARRLR